MKYVIIGNGVAGVSAAQTLALNTEKDTSITIFSDEEFEGYYNRPKLPAFIKDDNLTVQELITYTLEWYNERKIDFHPDEKVVLIKPNVNQLITSKNTYSYDKLLIATGAECWCPPIPGRELKHFYTVRNLTDAAAIKKKLRSSNNAVVIGGGVLGLEIANASISQGVNTTVIEYFPYLLPRQLDQEGGDFLRKILEKRGIKFILNGQVEAVIGKDKVEQVNIKERESILSDLIMTCTGILPRKSLVEKFVETNKGIIVNNFMQTTNDTIYAAGDCVEHNNIIYGLIPPSIKQAQIAATNMVNGNTDEYLGSKFSATLKVTDLLLSSFGYTGKEKELGYEEYKVVNEDLQQYIKIFTHNDKIKSAIILNNRKALTLIRNVFEKDLSLSKNMPKIRLILPNL